AKMAKTFDAVSACAGCLRDTIAKSPPTLAVGAASFRAQRPFLSEFTKLTDDLKPTVATLHGKLATINAALETGTPVLKRTPELNRLTGRGFTALDRLARNPVTPLALQALHLTFAPQGNHYQVLHGEAYSPAVDAQGNADCQVGQYGYMDGPLNGPDAKYPPANIDNPADPNPQTFNAWEKSRGGASHTSTLMDHP